MIAPGLDTEIIRRTELGDGTTVITARRMRTGQLRPFVVFVTAAANRYAQRVVDFSCAETAEHYHDYLTDLLNGGESDGTG